MRILAKYRCKKCKHVERYTFFDFLQQSVSGILMTIGCVVIVCGVFFVKYPHILGNSIILDLLSKEVDYAYTVYANVTDDQVRDEALNLTIQCSGSNSHCFAKALFNKLKYIRYVPVSKYKSALFVYEPMYTYKNGGNCRTLAVMYTSMVLSLGFNAEVVCSNKYRHCVSKVPIKMTIDDTYDKYAVVDLTISKFVVLNATQDVWDYMDKESE